MGDGPPSTHPAMKSFWIIPSLDEHAGPTCKSQEERKGQQTMGELGVAGDSE